MLVVQTAQSSTTPPIVRREHFADFQKDWALVSAVESRGKSEICVLSVPYGKYLRQVKQVFRVRNCGRKNLMCNSIQILQQIG